MGKKSTKDVFRSSEVKCNLGEKDIAEIASETFPRRQLSPQKLGLLRESVNRALSFLYAPVDNAGEMRLPVSDLPNMLRALDNKLALPTNRWLLTAAGRKYASTLKAKDNHAFDSLMMKCGYADYGDFVEATISRFREVLEQMRKWTNDRKYLDQVLTDLSPRLKTRTILIRSLLPLIFEEVFERKCGIGATPGTRFIVAVLRKSRLHKGNTKAIQAAVVKSRHRGKAVKKLKALKNQHTDTRIKA